MNKYIKPEIELKNLDVVDVIQTSGLDEELETDKNGLIVIPDPVSEANALSLWK